MSWGRGPGELPVRGCPGHGAARLGVCAPGRSFGRPGLDCSPGASARRIWGLRDERPPLGRPDRAARQSGTDRVLPRHGDDTHGDELSRGHPTRRCRHGRSNGHEHSQDAAALPLALPSSWFASAELVPCDLRHRHYYDSTATLVTRESYRCPARSCCRFAPRCSTCTCAQLSRVCMCGSVAQNTSRVRPGHRDSTLPCTPDHPVCAI